VSDVTVRPAGEADLAAMATVWVAGWQAGYAGVVPAAHLAALDPQFRYQQLVAGSGAADAPERYLADCQGQVVGFVWLGAWRGADASAELGEIGAIYLDPAHWRQGIGRLLMSRAEQRLTELGYAEGRLWVLADNPRARRFYEAIGWHDDGGRQTYEVGGAVLPEVRYARTMAGRPADG